MKIGIMQPYFFPYIGYWQLMNLVDKYVIYDDVNYIKGGWINRNKILVDGKAQYFNLPMLGASPNKLIKDVEVNQDSRLKNKNIQTLKNAYRKAPYFSEAFPVVEQVLMLSDSSIAEYLKKSFEILKKYLGITTELIFSSDIEKNNEKRGQDKVLEICKKLNADQYINAIGGQNLYDRESFSREKIELKFLSTDQIIYRQFHNDFVSNLSIIDVMMFNNQEAIREMMEKFTFL